MKPEPDHLPTQTRTSGEAPGPPSGSASARTISTGELGDAPLGDSSPAEIAGFEIVRELHRGGQGIVYLAWQRSPRRQVALKVLKRGQRSGGDELLRFAREVQALGTLRHPHVVAIHSSGVVDGAPYLVMDFIAGESLSTLIAPPGRPVAEVLALGTIICDALRAVHACGIVHRDLKPSNIRLDGENRPIVVDFGLAKLDAGARGTSETVTESGQFVGSLPWASPEQALGELSKIDARTDVYALGVVLYQLLTGTFPFEMRGDARAVRERILCAQPIPPRSLRRDIPRDLETIVLKCLAKPRERRYADAGALLDDLQRVRAGRPILARRENVLYRAGASLRWRVQRQPLVALSGMTVAAVLLGLSVIAFATPLRPLDRALELRLVAAYQQREAAGFAPEIALLAFDDETQRRRPELEVQSGLTPSADASWRRLHGVLARRLAEIRPRVVAWDVNFATAQPDQDGDFVAGLDALRSAGVRVVLGVARFDEQRRPLLAPGIRERADAIGSIMLHRVREASRGVTAVIDDPPYAPLPGFALAAMLEYRYPRQSATVDWPRDLLIARVRLGGLNGSGATSQSPSSIWISVKDQFMGWSVDLPPEVEAPERRAGVRWALTPDERVVQAATVRYEDVLTPGWAGAAALADRLVIIADHRTQRSVSNPDIGALATRDGRTRTLPKSYLQATAVSDLLQDVHPNRLGLIFQVGALLGVALAGVLLAALLRPRLTVGLLLAALGCAAIVGLAWLAASQAGQILPVGGLLVSFLVALTGASWVALARRVYSALERPDP